MYRGRTRKKDEVKVSILDVAIVRVVLTAGRGWAMSEIR